MQEEITFLHLTFYFKSIKLKKVNIFFIVSIVIEYQELIIDQFK